MARDSGVRWEWVVLALLAAVTVRMQLLGAREADAATAGDALPAVCSGEFAVRATGERVEVRLPARGGRVVLERRGADAVFAHEGGAECAVRLAAAPALAVLGSERDDTLAVSFGGGSPVPRGGLLWDGRGEETAAGDALELEQYEVAALRSTYVDASSGYIVLEGGSLPQPAFVAYTRLEPLGFGGTAADLVLTFPDGRADIQSVDVFLNNTNCHVRGPTFEDTTFTYPSSSLTLVGGNQSDSFVIDFGEVDVHLDVVVVGNGGVDHVEVVRSGPNPSVNASFEISAEYVDTRRAAIRGSPLLQVRDALEAYLGLVHADAVEVRAAHVFADDVVAKGRLEVVANVSAQFRDLNGTEVVVWAGEYLLQEDGASARATSECSFRSPGTVWLNGFVDCRAALVEAEDVGVRYVEALDAAVRAGSLVHLNGSSDAFRGRNRTATLSVRVQRDAVFPFSADVADLFASVDIRANGSLVAPRGDIDEARDVYVEAHYVSLRRVEFSNVAELRAATLVAVGSLEGENAVSADVFGQENVRVGGVYGDFVRVNVTGGTELLADTGESRGVNVTQVLARNGTVYAEPDVWLEEEQEVARLWHASAVVHNVTANITSALLVRGWGQRRDGSAWDGVRLGRVRVDGGAELRVEGDGGVFGASGITLAGLVQGNFSDAVLLGRGGGQYNASAVNATNSVPDRRCGISAENSAESGVALMGGRPGHLTLEGWGGNAGVRSDGLCITSRTVRFETEFGDIAVTGIAGSYAQRVEGLASGSSGVYVSAANATGARVLFSAQNGTLLVNGTADQQRLQRNGGGSHGVHFVTEATGQGNLEMLAGGPVTVRGRAAACATEHSNGVRVEVEFLQMNSTRSFIDVWGSSSARANTSCDDTLDDGRATSPDTSGVVVRMTDTVIGAADDVVIRGYAHSNGSLGAASGVAMEARDSITIITAEDVNIVGVGGDTAGSRAHGVHIRAEGDVLILPEDDLDINGEAGEAALGGSSGVLVEAALLVLEGEDINVIGQANTVGDSAVVEALLSNVTDPLSAGTPFASYRSSGVAVDATEVLVRAGEDVFFIGRGSNATFCSECRGVDMRFVRLEIVALDDVFIEGTGTNALTAGFGNSGVHMEYAAGNPTIANLTMIARELEILGLGGLSPQGLSSGVFFAMNSRQPRADINGNVRIVGRGGDSVPRNKTAAHLIGSHNSYGENYGVRFTTAGAYTRSLIVADGDVTITGFGGDSNGDGRNSGVALGLTDGTVVSSGDITIWGRAGSSQTSGGNVGVELQMIFNGTAGELNITGYAAPSTQGGGNVGVQLSNAISNVTQVTYGRSSNSSAALISVVGFGAPGSTGGNAGVAWMWPAVMQCENLDVRGIGANSTSGGRNSGVQFEVLDNRVGLVATQAIRIYGEAGRSESGEGNAGVSAVAQSLHVEAFNLRIEGTGGDSVIGGRHHGVELRGGTALGRESLLLSAANISLAGTAGRCNESVSGNVGIRIDRFHSAAIECDTFRAFGRGGDGANGGNTGVLVTEVSRFRLSGDAGAVIGEAGSSDFPGQDSDGVVLDVQSFQIGVGRLNVTGIGGAGPVDSAGVAVLTGSRSSIDGVFSVDGTSGPGARWVKSYGVRVQSTGNETLPATVQISGQGEVNGFVAPPPSVNTTVESDYRYGIYKSGVQLEHAGGATVVSYYGSMLLRSGGEIVAQNMALVRLNGSVAGDADLRATQNGTLHVLGTSPFHYCDVHVRDDGTYLLDGETGCSVSAREDGAVHVRDGSKIGGELTMRVNSTLYPGGDGEIGCFEVTVLRYDADGVWTANTQFDVQGGGNTPCVHFDQVQVRDLLVFDNNTLTVNSVGGVPSSDVSLMRVKRGYFAIIGSPDARVGDAIGVADLEEIGGGPKGNDVIVSFP